MSLAFAIWPSHHTPAAGNSPLWQVWPPCRRGRDAADPSASARSAAQRARGRPARVARARLPRTAAGTRRAAAATEPRHVPRTANETTQCSAATGRTASQRPPLPAQVGQPGHDRRVTAPATAGPPSESTAAPAGTGQRAGAGRRGAARFGTGEAEPGLTSLGTGRLNTGLTSGPEPVAGTGLCPSASRTGREERPAAIQASCLRVDGVSGTS